MNRHTVTTATSPPLTSGNAVTVRVAVVTVDRHAALATVTPVQPCDLRKHGPGDGCGGCDGRVPFLSPRGCVGRTGHRGGTTERGRTGSGPAKLLERLVADSIDVPGSTFAAGVLRQAARLVGTLTPWGPMRMRFRRF